MIHELKILPEYFLAVVEGRKKFEIRKYDRDYQIGDTLILKEWDREYTGSAVVCEITYILHGGNYGLEKGYCILSIDAKMIGCIDMSNQEDKTFIKKKEDFEKEWNRWGNKQI